MKKENIYIGAVCTVTDNQKKSFNFLEWRLVVQKDKDWYDLETLEIYPLNIRETSSKFLNVSDYGFFSFDKIFMNDEYETGKKLMKNKNIMNIINNKNK